MYPITHAWFARRLWGEPADIMLLGTMFPDTTIVSGLDWGLTHKPGFAVVSRVASLGGDEHEFALGWLSHSTDPNGLDYFSDDEFPGTKRGYCFELALPYAERAARICGLPEELGWWKAHNFVEMGIELLAATAWPEGAGRCEAALAGAGEYGALVRNVASALGVDPRPLREGYAGFACFLRFDDLSPEGLASAYERQVHAKHGVDHIDREAAAALIAECARLAEPTLPQFLDYAAQRVLETAAGLTPSGRSAAR